MGSAGNTILRAPGVYFWYPALSEGGASLGGVDPTSMIAGIKRGFSQQKGARQAVAELRAQIQQPDPALVVFFCSADYDRDELAAAMREAFPGMPVVGCTTAGEITPVGYRKGTLTGISLSRQVCRAEAVLVEQLDTFAFSRGLDAVR